MGREQKGDYGPLDPNYRLVGLPVRRILVPLGDDELVGTLHN